MDRYKYGRGGNPNYRSRLVARGINNNKRTDLFAATPPLEASKVILAMTVTSTKGELIMVNDVSRAFFPRQGQKTGICTAGWRGQWGRTTEVVWTIELFNVWNRDAAQNLFDEYSQQLLNIGFIQGAATPCVFYNQERGIRTFVFGGDYVSIGRLESLN